MHCRAGWQSWCVPTCRCSARCWFLRMICARRSLVAGWLSVVVWGWQEQMVAEQAEREAALQKRYADLQRERAALTAS